MRAWERTGGGRVGMGRAQRMPRSCKRTWHALQSGILFHPGWGRCQAKVRERSLPWGQDWRVNSSQRPETILKARKWTVALTVGPQTEIGILLLILIPSFIFFWILLWTLLFWMFLSPWTWAAFLFLLDNHGTALKFLPVFSDTYWHQKPTLSCQILGWVKGRIMRGGCTL